MKTAPLYIALATLCQRYRNTARQFALGNPSMAEHCLEEAHRLVREYMPSGSGFDAGTELVIDVCDERCLVFKTAFHHMDEHGGYAGWTEHKVKVTAEFGGFDIYVVGRDRDQIKDYIAETFHQALNLEVGYRELPDSPKEPVMTKEQRAKAAATMAFMSVDGGLQQNWLAYQEAERIAEESGNEECMDALMDAEYASPWAAMEGQTLSELLDLIDSHAQTILEAA
jgi:hypothetical protein